MGAQPRAHQSIGPKSGNRFSDNTMRKQKRASDRKVGTGFRIIRCANKKEHRTGKGEPVFGQSDAQAKKMERRDDSIRTSGAPGFAFMLPCKRRRSPSD